MKCSLVSACFVASSASALHLPFTRRTPTTTSSLVSRPRVLADSGSLSLNNTVNNFYSSILTVNGKDVPMSLDTGSTDLWLYEYEDGLLDSARVDTDLSLTDSYGQGSVSGYISQIDVSFAGFNVTNQTFLYVQKQKDTSIIEGHKAAGLLGLGFDTLSNINGLVQQTVTGATWGRSLLSNIFASDPKTPNHITFRLDRLYDSNDTDTGSFDIGTFASGLEAVNNTTPIPVFNSNSTQNLYWSVLLDGIAFNGKNQTLKSTVTKGNNVPSAGKLAVVLDTGYSLPQLTTDLAHTIYASMGGVLYTGDTTNATYLVPCTAQGNLTFYIGEHTISIHPLDLTVVNNAQIGDKNFTVCINAFQPFTSQAGGGIVDLILGDAFLRNTYTVYDFGNLASGTSGQPNQDPFIKLLPLTDPAQASSEFQTARAAYLKNMPPQLNVSTVNSNNPQAISSNGVSPSGGSNGATKLGVGVGTAIVSALCAIGGVLSLL